VLENTVGKQERLSSLALEYQL